VAFFVEPDRPVGWSKVVRTDDEVRMRFWSSEIGEGAAVTIWWIVFNNPEACSDACGEDDSFIDGNPALGFNEAGIEAADIVAGYSTGAVANKNGRAFFQDTLGAGEIGDELIAGEAPLIEDSRRAEIHLVARTHGPAIKGMVDEQIGSYGVGCEVFLLPASDTGNEVGVCSDIQFSVHLP
jgi:hypothetical protein